MMGQSRKKNHEGFELWQITKLKQPARNGNKQQYMWVWNQQPKVEGKWCPKVRKNLKKRKKSSLNWSLWPWGREKKRNHNSNYSSSWEVLVLLLLSKSECSATEKHHSSSDPSFCVGTHFYEYPPHSKDCFFFHFFFLSIVLFVRAQILNFSDRRRRYKHKDIFIYEMCVYIETQGKRKREMKRWVFGVFHGFIVLLERERERKKDKKRKKKKEKKRGLFELDTCWASLEGEMGWT